MNRHPSPLTIVWGDLDPIAVWPMAERVHEARPDLEIIFALAQRLGFTVRPLPEKGRCEVCLRLE